MLHDVVADGVHGELARVENDVVGDAFLAVDVDEVVAEPQHHAAVAVHGDAEAVGEQHRVDRHPLVPASHSATRRPHVEGLHDALDDVRPLVLLDQLQRHVLRPPLHHAVLQRRHDDVAQRAVPRHEVDDVLEGEGSRLVHADLKHRAAAAPTQQRPQQRLLLLRRGLLEQQLVEVVPERVADDAAARRRYLPHDRLQHRRSHLLRHRTVQERLFSHQFTSPTCSAFDPFCVHTVSTTWPRNIPNSPHFFCSAASTSQSPR